MNLKVLKWTNKLCYVIIFIGALQLVAFENYYQNGGKNGHNFIWWLMSGVSTVAGVSQCTDAVTPDE